MRTLSATVALVSSSLLAGGCAHERLPSASPAGDIERVNATAEKDGRLRAQYVEPIATAQWVRVSQPTAIASVEDPRVGFGATDTGMRLVPSEMREKADVSDPWTGALIGGALGAAVGGIEVFGVFALEYLWKSDDSSAPPSPCRNICDTGDVAQLLIPTIAIGAAAGYIVGSLRTVHRGTRGY